MKLDGSCDVSIVDSVCRELKKHITSDKIIVRSTVPVGTCRYLGVNHMPEFLTESNWEEDFRNPRDEYRYIGLRENYYPLQRKINDFFYIASQAKVIAPCTICYCTTEESELIKYTRNAFLATKVSFFNEIEEYCAKMGIDYKMVRACAVRDERIGDSHTKVPGSDGKRGFGGSCFRKDVASLLEQLESTGMESHIIKATITRNNKIDMNRTETPPS
jgi:UDPglucose 6-dehydrogenase